MTGDSWQPTCSPEMLQTRAMIIRALRRVLDDAGFIEVHTPCVARDCVIDAWLDPYRIHRTGAIKSTEGINPEERFLQTSPEACMKRLLAAGSDRIYQLGPVWRAGEIGKRHNPEFLMLEWYATGSSLDDEIRRTEELCRAAALAIHTSDFITKAPFRRTTYQHAFRMIYGIDPLAASTEEIRRAGQCRGVTFPDSLESDDRDGLLNVMLAEHIEPTLGKCGPEFLMDYPPSQAALAQVAPGPPEVALRFELYSQGLELCNGYQELLDAKELKRRELRENALREKDGREVLPGAPLLREAMSAGLPACSGVALGVDRLVMALTEKSSIRDVIPFPWDCA